jgi:mRNA-degrading endonuclease toxin of MazEF toxin-antitoxin module
MDSAEGRVAGLRVDSVIDCTVVATIPKALLISKIGQLSKETMLRVEKYIRGDSAGET